MSVRFTCTACHTVLKVAVAVTEERKVRCTGCGIVIVLTPDDDSPTGMTISVPQKGEYASPSERLMRHRRNILLASLAVGGVVLVVLLWWFLRGPTDRGAIEGNVTLDDAPLENGRIVFVPVDSAKGTAVTISIVRGHYRVRAADGPWVGKNRVEIHAEKEGGGERVAKRFNAESTTMKDIVAGANSQDFDVKSR